MEGTRGSRFLGPEPQNSHRKCTAAVSTASAGPGQATPRHGPWSGGKDEAVHAPGSGAPCADPQTDTSVHVSHATPQRHCDLGDHRDPRGQQREHQQEPGVCTWGQKGTQGASPGSVAPPSATKGISILSVGGRPSLSAQTHVLDPLLGDPPHPTPRDHRLDGTGDPVPWDRVTGPAQRRHLRRILWEGVPAGGWPGARPHLQQRLVSKGHDALEDNDVGTIKRLLQREGACTAPMPARVPGALTAQLLGLPNPSCGCGW